MSALTITTFKGAEQACVSTANLEVPAISLDTELAMHNMIVQLMEKQLAGYEIWWENKEILKGDVDWTTQCIVTFRRNEKAVANWFLESGDIIQMNLEDAKTAVKTGQAKN